MTHGITKKADLAFKSICFHHSVFGFEKTSYHSIWKALYETRLMFQHVLCVVLFHAESQLWMVLLRYLFVKMYFLYMKEKKNPTMPSLLFRSCWWKPISEQEFFETIKMSKHRNLLNQGNCTSTTLYFFFWLVTAEI